MAPARPDHSAITIIVDGSCIEVNSGVTVAAALMHAGIPCRRSVRGEPRAPLCGMGICFVCAATVDGEPLRRTCQVMCRAGMEVVTE